MKIINWFDKYSWKDSVQYLTINNFYYRNTKKTIQYSAFDKKNWTANPESWDPLVFYVCANKFKCIVSIQADDTEEFRIYPDILSVELIVKFGQLNQSEFVYLKSNRKIFGKWTIINLIKMCSVSF